MATMPSALNIEVSAMIPVGRVALLRHGELVWVGNLADPWDDVEFDLILLSEPDFENVSRKIADEQTSI